MFNETLEELIEGLFSNPEDDPVSDLIIKKPTLKQELRWKGVFRKPFLPGTRVTRGESSGVIVDHTEIKCGDIKSENCSYRNYNGNDLEMRRRSKGKMWKNMCLL